MDLIDLSWLHGRTDAHADPQIRFSNDKTPYKTGFSASFSRSGRKGIFAACEAGLPIVWRYGVMLMEGLARSCVRFLPWRR